MWSSFFNFPDMIDAKKKTKKKQRKIRFQLKKKKTRSKKRRTSTKSRSSSKNSPHRKLLISDFGIQSRGRAPLSTSGKGYIRPNYCVFLSTCISPWFFTLFDYR